MTEPRLASITVPPLGCYFANENKAMGLRPHQHYAEVTLTWDTMGPLGFPVFQDTVDALRGLLRDWTERPFRDATNEDVASVLWHRFSNLADDVHKDLASTDHTYGHALEVLRGWGGEYRLGALELAVMGAPDDIGHSEGMARYRIER